MIRDNYYSAIWDNIIYHSNIAYDTSNIFNFIKKKNIYYDIYIKIFSYSYIKKYAYIYLYLNSYLVLYLTCTPLSYFSFCSYSFKRVLSISYMQL